MIGAIATAVAELAKISNKIMDWFSPGQRTKANKAELDRLEKRKGAILRQPATVKRSQELQRISKKITALQSKLHS